VLLSWRRFRERATHVLHLDEEPSRLAAGMAAGVFIGITPFYGLHTLLALLAAYVFRLNKVATITGAWMNLPWFAPFVYGFALRLGTAVLAGDLGSFFSLATLYGLAESAGQALRADPRESAGTLWHYLRQVAWDMLFTASVPLFVGTTIVGAALAAVAYFLTLEAVRDVRRLRERRHPPAGPAPARRPGGAP
jgi:uncharacterized protein (DUF2062 family)